MLYEIMKYLHNFFFDGKSWRGIFEIENGHLDIDGLKDGQYFAVFGSTFNDGVHQYPSFEMTDEMFVGIVKSMAVPKAFLELVEKIEAFQEGNKLNGFQSESFDGYSYERIRDSQGNVASWEKIFKNELSAWRKI